MPPQITTYRQMSWIAAVTCCLLLNGASLKSEASAMVPPVLESLACTLPTPSGSRQKTGPDREKYNYGWVLDGPQFFQP